MVTTATAKTLARTEAVNVFQNYFYMGFGTDTTAESVLDTALGGEVFRVASFGTAKSIANGTYQFQARIPLGEANTGTIGELGLFDASSNGNMALRKLLSSGVAKTSDDELIFTVTITASVS